MLKFPLYLLSYDTKEKSEYIIVKELKIDRMTLMWVFLQLRNVEYSNKLLCDSSSYS